MAEPSCAQMPRQDFSGLDALPGPRQGVAGGAFDRRPNGPTRCARRERRSPPMRSGATAPRSVFCFWPSPSRRDHMGRGVDHAMPAESEKLILAPYFPHWKVISRPSVKLDPAPTPSRYHAWKNQVCPLATGTKPFPWGKAFRSTVRLNMPLAPELTI